MKKEPTYYCTNCHSYFHEPAELDNRDDPYRDPWSNGFEFVCPECGSEHYNQVD